MHTQHLFLGQPTGNEFAPRRVGAVGAEFPVAVAALAAAEGHGVGVAFERQPVGHFAQHVAQFTQHFAHGHLHHGAAAGEHRPALGIDDLDAQAVARHLQQDLRRQPGDLRVGLDLLLELLLDVLQPCHLGAQLLGLELVHVDGGFGGLDVAALDLAGAARQVLAAALDDVRRVTRAAAAVFNYNCNGVFWVTNWGKAGENCVIGIGGVFGGRHYFFSF